MKKTITIVLLVIIVAGICALTACNKTHTHTWSEWQIEVKPTCTETGTRTRTCSCGEEETETISAKGHTVVTDAAVDATCAKEGLTAGKHCSVCGQTLEAQQTVPKKAHTPVTDHAVAATCEVDGFTEGSHCSVCGEVLTAQNTVPALGHSPITKNINEIAPTCEENGSYVELTYCARCDAELNRATHTISATGHDYDYQNIVWHWLNDNFATATVVCKHDGTHTQTVNATVTSNVQNGVRTYTATLTADGRIYSNTKSENINYSITWIWDNDYSTAMASFVSTDGSDSRVVAATINAITTLEASCESTGTCTYTASATFNGTTYTDQMTQTIAASGHNWSEWTTTTPATCTANGTKVHSCSRCGATETATIYSVGHDWGVWTTVTPATCENAGLKMRTCTVCGAVDNQTVPALTHAWGEWVVTKEPTCTETGSKYRVCAHDATHKETQTIAKVAHTYGAWQTVKEATPEENGVRERTCAVCDNTQTEYITYTGEIITTYTITYANLMGATHDNPTAYTSTTATIVLTAPTSRTGYTFDGWYDSLDAGNKITSIPQGSTADIDLYAHWSITRYTITYLDIVGLPTNPTSYTAEDAFDLAAPVARAGYTFAEWQDEEGQPATGIALGEEGNRTFRAVWTTVTYTITYIDVLSAPNDNPTQYTVVTPTFALTDAVLAGYTFDGWYDHAEGGQKVTAVSQGTTGDITVYARRTPNVYSLTIGGEEAETYTVTFDGNGATIDIADQTVTLLDGLTYPNVPTRSGYLFAGWYVTPEGTGVGYDFQAEVQKDITLYAKWIAADGAVLTIGGNTSVVISGQTMRYYDFVPLVTGTITAYSTGSVDAYAFLYRDGTQLTYNDDGGENTNFRLSYNVTAGVKYQLRVRGYSTGSAGTSTVYLTGTALPADGGLASGGGDTISVTYGEAYSLDVAAFRPGFTFEGYYTDIDCGGTRITDDEGNSLTQWAYTEGLVVYAGYLPTQYTITFDSQGGSAVAPLTLDYGDALNVTVKPTLDNKSFVGWYRATSDAEPYQAATMPAEDFTLYAKWINYNLNDFKYDESKLAVRVEDDITAALFSAVLVDTDGDEVEVTASIVDGEQTVGTTISVRLLATGKYNKRKSVTIDGVKVYGTPTLTYDDTRDYINLSDPLDGVPFSASGKDSFDQDTVITATIDGAYQGGDVVSVTLVSTDPAGNTATATVADVKVYDRPIITYDDITAAKVGDTIDLAFFGASAVDNFGVDCEVQIAVNGTQAAGQTLTVTLSATDVKGNTATITIALAIYGTPTVNLPVKMDFKVTDDITVESMGATATDSHDCAVADVAISLKSGTQTAGATLVYTVTATDIVGNVASRDFEVYIYGAPTIEQTKTAVKDVDNLENYAVYGVVARDSFGRSLTLDATITAGEQTKGTVLTVTFDATDRAGNAIGATYDFDVLAAEDISLTYYAGLSDVIKLTSKGEEFNATATDSMGSACTVEVVGIEDTIGAGKTMSIKLRATDRAGNTKDSDVITDVKVYGMPTATYKKHEQWYLLDSDSRANLFRVADSFGEELYTEETEVEETTDEYRVRVTADPDEAGNVFDQVFTLTKIAAGTSLIDLYADGERIGGQVVAYGEAYTLPCPAGYRYVWKIDDVAITDDKGASLAAWNKADGRYTAIATVEVITYTITYNLNGGENSADNPSAYTVLTVGDGITLADPTKTTERAIKEYTRLDNGNYSVTYDATAYTFLGWYTESTFDNQVTAVTLSDGDIVLYAKWSETETTYTTTERAYTRDDNYLYFGTYPQAEVTDSSIKTALTTAAGTLPTASDSQAWTSYGYYISSSTATDYMWYIDLTYGGEQYRGVYFTQYRPYYTSTSSSAGNSNQDDNGYNTATVYWFLYEPIKWRILSESNGEALIFAEMALDSQEYCHYTTTSQFSHNGGTGYPNNYALSNIRKWLNETFYNTAFNDLQKELILLTTVDNSARSTSDTGNNLMQASSYACANTKDYIFLLSDQEVTMPAYGFSGNYMDNNTARRKKNTDYARCQGAWTNTNSTYYGNGYWWLRSPYYGSSSDARCVNGIGNAGGNCHVYDTRSGVVPALRIKLS